MFREVKEQTNHVQTDGCTGRKRERVQQKGGRYGLIPKDPHRKVLNFTKRLRETDREGNRRTKGVQGNN